VSSLSSLFFSITYTFNRISYGYGQILYTPSHYPDSGILHRTDGTSTNFLLSLDLNESTEQSKTQQPTSNSIYNSSCDDRLEKNGFGIRETCDIDETSRTSGGPSSRSNRRILLHNERFLPTEGHGENSTTTITRATATLLSAGDEHVFR
jgi:hypothetical protein